jgi:hypothetical protein
LSFQRSAGFASAASSYSLHRRTTNPLEDYQFGSTLRHPNGGCFRRPIVLPVWRILTLLTVGNRRQMAGARVRCQKCFWRQRHFCQRAVYCHESTLDSALSNGIAVTLDSGDNRQVLPVGSACQKTAGGWPACLLSPLPTVNTPPIQGIANPLDLFTQFSGWVYTRCAGRSPGPILQVQAGGLTGRGDSVPGAPAGAAEAATPPAWRSTAGAWIPRGGGGG